ncbi:MAG: MarR family transcriptional regulator [Cyanobacteria bacterium P01_D01_bin.1]
MVSGSADSNLSDKDPVDKILAQWAKERPDLDVSPMGLIGRTTRLASHLRRAIGDTFSEFGLQPGEFDVLATLRRSGAPYQLSPTELFKSMMVSSGTMTNRIDRLENSGLVERIPDQHDRRGTLIHLTDKGFELIEAAVTAHVANEHRILDVLSQTEKEDLSKLLRKLLLSFEDKVAE